MGEIGEIWKEINEEVKVRRQNRMQRFLDDMILRLHKSEEVLSVDMNDAYCVIESKKFGKVHIYPKANRVLICKQNKWISGVMNWINQNLL